MNIQEYYDHLISHDWYYSFSDDHRVWSAGQRVKDELRLIASESEQHMKLFERFQGHYNTLIRGYDPDPLPERPKVGIEPTTSVAVSVNKQSKPVHKEDKMANTNTNLNEPQAKIMVESLKNDGDFDYFFLYRFSGHLTFGNALIKVQKGVPESYEANYPDCSDRYFLSVWSYTGDPKVKASIKLVTRISEETQHFSKENAILFLKLIGTKWGDGPKVVNAPNAPKVPKANANF